MPVQLLTSLQLAEDLPVPKDQKVVLFDFNLPLLPGRRKVRFHLQGGAFLNWYNSPQIGMTLKFELGESDGYHCVVISPTTIITPTVGGVGLPGVASGSVTFTGLVEGQIIPAGTTLMRDSSAVSYVATAEIAEEGGSAVVPAQAITPGAIGNCPAGTGFSAYPVGGGDFLYGVATDDFTGGADPAPGPEQFIVKTGGVSFIYEDPIGNPDTGHEHPVKIYVTEMAPRNAAPGFPMPTEPWRLCGRESAQPHGIAWRCTVEDLEGDTDAGTARPAADQRGAARSVRGRA